MLSLKIKKEGGIMFFVKLNRSKIKVYGEKGRLLPKGALEEHTSFLQSLLSNDIKSLKDGEFNYNLWLTPTGNPKEEFFVYKDEEEGKSFYLLDTPANPQEIIQTFEKLKLSLKVYFKDVSQEVSHYFIFGDEINEFVRKKFGITEDNFQFKKYKDILVAKNPLRINKVGFDLIGNEETIKKYLCSLKEIPQEKFEDIRINNCMPAIYKELNENIIPNETGFLDYMVSLTKGCYVGQEAVARVYYRGTPSRTLVKFTIKKYANVGDEILDNQKKIGFITSITSDGRRGLGYVLRTKAEKGKTFKIKDDKGYIKIEGICKPNF